MAKTPGFGERVEQQLKVRGYWKNGKLDYTRFGLEHGFHPTDVYRWWKGETPRALTLFRFAQALGVTADWLLGIEPKKRAGSRKTLAGLLLMVATGGVLAHPGTIGADEIQTPSFLSVIRRWWRWTLAPFVQPVPHVA
jgi:transcriptional regulator with XRE-family HTH domain